MASTLKLQKPQSEGGSSLCSETQTLAASASSAKFQMERVSQMTLLLDCTAASGTTPTLNVRVQKLLPDGTTWQDIASLTQITGVTKRVLHMVSGGNLEEAVVTRSLAAGTVNSVPFGGWWRLDYAVGGTNPSFTFTAWLEALA